MLVRAVQYDLDIVSPDIFNNPFKFWFKYNILSKKSKTSHYIVLYAKTRTSLTLNAFLTKYNT